MGKMEPFDLLPGQDQEMVDLDKVSLKSGETPSVSSPPPETPPETPTPAPTSVETPTPAPAETPTPGAETPTPGAETPAIPTIEDLARDNAVLRHQLGRLTRAFQELATPAGPTAPTMPELGMTLTQEEYDEAMSGPEGLAKVLNAKLKETLTTYDAFQMERSLRTLPDIIAKRRKEAEDAAEAADAFYEKYSELKPVREEIGDIFLEVLAKNPNATQADVPRLMEQTAQLARARFGIAAPTAKGPTGQPPTPGARREPRKEDPNSIAAQLRAMDGV